MGQRRTFSRKFKLVALTLVGDRITRSLPRVLGLEATLAESVSGIADFEFVAVSV